MSTARTPRVPGRRGPSAGSRWAGIGALRLGLKYADKFCSVFAHSSVIPTSAFLREREPTLSPERVRDMDCYRWATEIDPARAPSLAFDCGTENSLLDHNRAFHDHLNAVGLPHSYAERPRRPRLGLLGSARPDRAAPARRGPGHRVPAALPARKRGAAGGKTCRART